MRNAADIHYQDSYADGFDFTLPLRFTSHQDLVVASLSGANNIKHNAFVRQALEDGRYYVRDWTRLHIGWTSKDSNLEVSKPLQTSSVSSGLTRNLVQPCCAVETLRWTTGEADHNSGIRAHIWRAGCALLRRRSFGPLLHLAPKPQDLSQMRHPLLPTLW